MRQKAVWLNPSTAKKISREISFNVNLYDHPAVDFVHERDVAIVY